MNTRHAGAAALVASAGLAAPASARIITEDFMNDGGTAAQYDPFFSYDFGPSNDYTDGDSHNLLMGSLLLTPDKVRVTFNLLPGEEIVGARLLLHDYAGVGMTRVSFEGDLGTYTQPNFLQLIGETFIMPDTIGTLQRIVISGTETNLRWIEIETRDAVPAPGTIVLGAAGMGLLTRRRRR